VDILVTQEFVGICSKIVAERRTDDEWSQIESDDMFQSDSFVGGFDATEMAFCFSYYDPSGHEYWFQLTTGEIEDVAAGRVTSINARLAKK
jgi:hypothetical protein